MTSEENLLLETCLKYSMTTKTRMWSLLNSINYIHNYNIPGDFVECGCLERRKFNSLSTT